MRVTILLRNPSKLEPHSSEPQSLRIHIGEFTAQFGKMSIGTNAPSISISTTPSSIFQVGSISTHSNRIASSPWIIPVLSDTPAHSPSTARDSEIFRAVPRSRSMVSQRSISSPASVSCVGVPKTRSSRVALYSALTRVTPLIVIRSSCISTG